MYRVEFKNAVVKDHGYGIEVNDKSLADIISTLLGTIVPSKENFISVTRVGNFDSTCCDITITIDPKPVTEYIEDTDSVYHSVKEMEAKKVEQYEAENPETATEE